MKGYGLACWVYCCWCAILQCDIWKVRAIQWIFSVHQLETCRMGVKHIGMYNKISFSSPSHTTCWHAHAPDSSQWVDRTTSLSTLPCIISLCTAWGNRLCIIRRKLMQEGPPSETNLNRRLLCQSQKRRWLSFSLDSQHLQAKIPAAPVMALVQRC